MKRWQDYLYGLVEQYEGGKKELRKEHDRTQYKAQHVYYKEKERWERRDQEFEKELGQELKN